jgi:hypothetical protein
VEFGTTGSYGVFSSLLATYQTSRTVNIFGLTPNTLYHFSVRSRDSAGNLTISGDYVFTTTAAPDTTAPTISGVNAYGITSNGAYITWGTDEPADSQIEYGLSAGLGNWSPLDTYLVVTRNKVLAGLTANTQYSYRVRSRDAAGNLAMSGIFTFMTSAAADTTAPDVYNVQAMGVTSNNASIQWNTNEPAKARVEYGPTVAYGATTALSSYSRSVFLWSCFVNDD